LGEVVEESQVKDVVSTLVEHISSMVNDLLSLSIPSTWWKTYPSFSAAPKNNEAEDREHLWNICF
jgi:hypothetical protein